MSDDTDELKELESKHLSLKKKVGIITIFSIFFGSGGGIGLYKWIDSGRELTASQIRQSTIDSEIKKNNALNENFELQLKDLESKITEENIKHSEAIRVAKETALLKEERKKTNKKFRKVMKDLSGGK